MKRYIAKSEQGPAFYIAGNSYRCSFLYTAGIGGASYSILLRSEIDNKKQEDSFSGSTANGVYEFKSSVGLNYGQRASFKFVYTLSGDIQNSFCRIINNVTGQVYIQPASLSDSRTYYFEGLVDPESTPTYLETLDKLDQWSSAHYVPHNRRVEIN